MRKYPRFWQRCVWLCSVLIVWFADAGAQDYTVGNRGVSRSVRIEQNRLRSRQVVNHRTGETLALAGEEFALTVVSPEVKITPLPDNVIRIAGSDCVVDSVRADGGDRLRVYLHASRAPLQFVLQYDAGRSAGVILKTLRWRQSEARAGMPYFVETVCLEDQALRGTAIRGGGFGQPVFSGNAFWGIEYPAATATVDSGHFVLNYRLGKNATENWQESYPAVLGAADAGYVKHDFLRYIDSLRPNPVQPFLLYNSWYDIRDFNYPEFFDRIDFFREVLLKKYGQKLDALVLDDGWDDQQGRLWDVDRRKLPQELTPFGERLKAMGSTLGLWISPWGGYDQARRNRMALAQEQGYEHMGEFLCLAGDRYFDLFRRRVLDYQEKFNIGFWKIDGFLSTCNRADHGHPIGRFSRRVLLDRFLQILSDLRRQRPDVRIDITVGTWQSPWWLKWADYIWMGGGDFGFTQAVPSLSQRDQALTYRDQVMYDDLVTAGYAIPASAFMTHGIIKGQLNMLGGQDEPPQAFLKNAVMYFSRGVSMWELYLTPDRLSEVEWRGLARILQWGRRQWPLLQYTEFVGGAPYAGAVYGYAHFEGDRGLLTLRNPSPDVKKFALPLDEKLGKIKVSVKWHVLQKFPQQQGLPGAWRAGETFEVTLQPYETAVFEFYPEETPPELVVIGAPYRVVLENDGQGWLEIMPIPGKSFSVIINGAVRQAEDLRETPAGERELSQPKLNACNWLPTEAGVGAEVQLVIPEVWQQAELIVLYQPQAPRDSLRVRVAGAAAPHALRKDGNGAWWWITVPLFAGEQTVRLRLDGRVSPGDSARVFVRGIPKRRVLRMPLSEVNAERLLPELPIAWDRERVLVPLTEMQGVGR